MPGKIQQSLGMLTAYLNEENKKLDQEIKDKSLDVFLSKASGVFQTLDADATPDDARERYFQLLGIAGNMEVGKEATPFLNQMLSSSVAFIKDTEAKKFDKSFISQMNKNLGTSYDPNTTRPDDAAKLFGLDVSSTRVEGQFFNKEGQELQTQWKFVNGKYQQVKSDVKDERTDAQRQKQALELVSAKARIDRNNQVFSSQLPDWTTYTASFTLPDGTKFTNEPVIKQGGHALYEDRRTGKFMPLPPNAILDQKMSSATRNNSYRGTMKMDLEVAQNNINTYGRGLALTLKNLGSTFTKSVYDYSAAKFVENGQSFLYENKDQIAREILSKYPTDANISPELAQQRDSDLATLSKFVDSYDQYLNTQGQAKDFSSGTTDDSPIGGNELEGVYKDANSLIEQELNPETRTNSQAYNKILSILKKHKSFYDAGRGTAYGIWTGNNKGNGLSPQQKSAVLTEIGAIIITEQNRKKKEAENLNQVQDLWKLPKFKY